MVNGGRCDLVKSIIVHYLDRSVDEDTKWALFELRKVKRYHQTIAYQRSRHRRKRDVNRCKSALLFVTESVNVTVIMLEREHVSLAESDQIIRERRM